VKFKILCGADFKAGLPFTRKHKGSATEFDGVALQAAKEFCE
jgi:hypothetical protein